MTPANHPTNRPDGPDDRGDGRPTRDPGPGISTILPVVELPGTTRGRCGSQQAGHNPHPIQARLAVEHPGVPGTLVTTPDGEVALRPADGSAEIVLRNHRPGALIDALERYGPDGWKLSYGMLVHPGDGTPGTLTIGLCVVTGDQPLGRCTA